MNTIRVELARVRFAQEAGIAIAHIKLRKPLLLCSYKKPYT